MIQTKTVDITPMKITLPVIEMSQYDLGRQVIVHMKDGSDWFDLTGYTAKLQGTKPSGFGYTVDGVVDGHDITFASSYDMTSEAGFIPSEVRLTKDGVSLGSLNLILHVEKTPHDVTTTDGSPESLIPELTVLVNRAEAAVEVILDCSATATTLPAGSPATALYDVEHGVFSFGIPQGVKGDTGQTGATGNGIASIAKTGTSGLVDTYTIYFTDQTTTSFTVTNGQNGTGSVADVWQNGVSVLDGNTAKVVVPTKISDLTDDSDFVEDASYVHTDNNFTTALKNKLDGIASGAEVNVQSDWNQTTTTADDYIKNKPTSETASQGGTTLSLVTTGEKYNWDYALESGLTYLGVNPTNGDDTPSAWSAVGTGYARINSLSETTGQPSQWGVLINYVIGTEVSQEFRIAPSGAVFKRGAGGSDATMPAWARPDAVVVVQIASFSSLPQTVSDTKITSDMVCLKAELGNPTAQTGDWTVTTSAGSLTLSGSISGSTTAKLYLAVAQ